MNLEPGYAYQLVDLRAAGAGLEAQLAAARTKGQPTRCSVAFQVQNVLLERKCAPGRNTMVWLCQVIRQFNNIFRKHRRLGQAETPQETKVSEATQAARLGIGSALHVRVDAPRKGAIGFRENAPFYERIWIRFTYRSWVCQHLRCVGVLRPDTGFARFSGSVLDGTAQYV